MKKPRIDEEKLPSTFVAGSCTGYSRLFYRNGRIELDIVFAERRGGEALKVGDRLIVIGLGSYLSVSSVVEGIFSLEQ